MGRTWRGKAYRRSNGGIILAQRMPPEKVTEFATTDAVVHAGLQMLAARRALMQSAKGMGDSGDKHEELDGAERAWTTYWHAAVDRSTDTVEICRYFRRYRLTRLEREILMILAIDQLGLWQEDVRSTCKILELLRLPPGKVLAGARCLDREGRLFKLGLAAFDDDEDLFTERRLVPDPGLVEIVLYDRDLGAEGWPVKTEGDLYDYLARLTNAFQQKSESMEAAVKGYGNHSKVFAWQRKCERLIQAFLATVRTHRGWGLSQVGKIVRCADDRAVVLALVGKELGHAPPDDGLFTGLGLARAMSEKPMQVQGNLDFLRKLAEKEIIQPCAGLANLFSGDPREIEESEFELSDKTRAALKLMTGAGGQRASKGAAREPKVCFDQLAIVPEIRKELDLAIAQERHADTLFKTWGLAKRFPNGRGSVLLFYGPPGTGKTATAEALAKELNRFIIVADYSKIQNCFVGVTEKNIVKTFREARAANAVLFWDEADAMFYDRDGAQQSWETRDVNVLLQEIERFEGVCILATNRQISMDKALERRISIRIEFRRPDRAARRQIWKRMFPKELPVASDVDIDTLSERDLSGGEIKNVVLNACRLAVSREEAVHRVSMRDFTEAIAMELTGQWTGRKHQKIGFQFVREPNRG